MTNEEAIKELNKHFPSTSCGEYKELIKALNMAIEALQKDIKRHEMVIRASERHLGIVRCKDCKYRDPEDERCDHGAVNFLLRRTDDDYCSYGERKGGDDE